MRIGGWRYWHQQRLARELREVYRSDWNSIRAEVTARLQKRLEPPEVKHFQALDRVRLKEIEALEAAADLERAVTAAEIARLEELLRQAGLQYWKPVGEPS